MKKQFNLLQRPVSVILLLMAVSLLFCCKKSNPNPYNLPQSVLNIIPESMINQMASMGQKIYSGTTPPTVVLSDSSTYYATPVILTASNVPGDVVGSTRSDFQMTLSHENAANQTITYGFNWISLQETGSGLGAYILGKDSTFTIFSADTTYYSTYPAGCQTAIEVYVISGIMRTNGIENMQWSHFMLDNYGNSCGQWLGNGQGRVEDIGNTGSFATLQ